MRPVAASARVLDDCVAGGEQTVTLGALDHRERHAVLHGARRVVVLELQPQLKRRCWARNIAAE
jgi:hypothetical protein